MNPTPGGSREGARSVGSVGSAGSAKAKQITRRTSHRASHEWEKTRLSSTRL